MGPQPPTATERGVTVPAGTVTLAGELTVPPRPAAVVVFAHGSGSGRRSPRNRTVADALVDTGLATLLIDLLTEDEAAEDSSTGRFRFDVERLSARVVAAIDWLAEDETLRGLPVGCFGASTGAAAALLATAERPRRVAAVVSRGGRPDLARAVLPHVIAPTLLIVGGNDPQVLELNRRAATLLPNAPEVAIVPGASHLFEEPGALEHVRELTRDWFARQLPVEVRS